MTSINAMLQACTVNGSQEQTDTNILTAAHCAFNAWLVRD